MDKKTIIFCGGGSGGHVVPALTMITKIKKETDWNIEYIGGHYGIERKLAEKNNLSYHGISVGKLRRYISVENFFDILRVLKGVFDSFLILFNFSKSDSIIFSFGGFVSVPIVLAGWLQGKRIYIHEQTSRVGLANKIASRFAKKIFISFESSKEFFPDNRTIYTGYPVREECFLEKKEKSSFEGGGEVSKERPLLFITGGGNGSYLINKIVHKNLEELKNSFIILHQVGAQFIEKYKKYNDESYKAIDFVGDEMIDLLKNAKVVVSRSGAGTVAELLAIGRPSLFIPLKIAQKNEQYFNAKEAEENLGSIIIKEDELTDELFLSSIKSLSEKDQTKKYDFKNGSDEIMKELFLIEELKT